MIAFIIEKTLVLYCWKCKTMTVHRRDRWGTLICTACGEYADG